MPRRMIRSLAWPSVALIITACSPAQQAVPPPQASTINTPAPSSPGATTSAVTAATPADETPSAGPDQPPATVIGEAPVTTASLPAADSSPVEPDPPGSLRFVRVAEGARNPIFLTARPGAEHSYLAEQGGRVLYMAGGELDERPVLDITDRVTSRGEQGLLGLALHPTDPTRLLVHYSDRQGHTVVSEFSLSGDGRTADPGSERIVFFARQPATNHNGGMIQFGPDGFLYLGLGDGGGAGDRYGHGQRPDTPLAALVRIDPDQLTSRVWWYGLRNPWRFWIDHPTGLAYTADVGQDAYEEINVAPLSEPGLNFGWPVTEGLHCHQPRRDCDPSGLTPPVLEVSHGDGGTCSITGGVVYRGPAMPALWGQYFYSDYCGGYVRSLLWNGTIATDLREWTADLGPVVSFGTDGAREMYVLTVNTVYRIEPGG